MGPNVNMVEKDVYGNVKVWCCFHGKYHVVKDMNDPHGHLTFEGAMFEALVLEGGMN